MPSDLPIPLTEIQFPLKWDSELCWITHGNDHLLAALHFDFGLSREIGQVIVDTLNEKYEPKF